MNIKKTVEEIFFNRIVNYYDGLPGYIELTFSEKTKTASVVMKKNKYFLLVNENFIKNYKLNRIDVEFILHHEFTHLKNGDLYKHFSSDMSESDRLTANIVLDCMINSRLLSKMPKYENASIFTKLYDNEKFPSIILFPPCLSNNRKNRIENIKKVLLDNNFNEYQINDLVDLYLKMWDLKITETQAFYRLKEYIFKKEQKEIIFIGSHSFKGIKPSKFNDDIIEVLKENLEYEKKQADLNKLKNFIIKAIVEGDNLKINTKNEITMDKIIPAISRTDMLFNYFEVDKLLYKNKEIFDINESKNISIYIDVSGSFYHSYPVLKSILLSLNNFLVSEYFQFSNYVYKIKFEDFKEGIIRTTHGTDIDCVLKHIIKNNVKKAVIITDGYIDEPENELIESIKRRNIQIYTILTQRGSENLIKKFSKDVWNISLFTNRHDPLNRVLKRRLK